MTVSTEDGARAGLGTFLGVFLPTILTILGVIMYLRFGWVVGNAGLGATLLIVLLSNALTLVTSLSVASVSTNMRVGAGGAYFIISRSMGLEIGGAIGLPLFLSQTLSVTLYCYGLAESVRLVWPDAPVMIIAGAIVVLVCLLAARSMVFALRLQVPILGLVGLSLLSLFLGADWAGEVHWGPGGYEDADFWEVFAVFFPAVTGILAGVSLSGDLENPDRSLPLGTVLAVLAAMAVYLVVPVALSATVTPGDLRSNSLIWMEVAYIPALVLPGLWGAILSSAIGSVLGAPRTLGAMADHGRVNRRLSASSDENGEARMPMILTSVLAIGAVLLGDLNTVAEVVAMFFLTTYGMMNIACALEGLVGDHSFRPRFRLHWAMPLAGAVGCFWVMLLINTWAALLAVAIEVLVWAVLKRRSMETSWGDVRSGALMSLALWALNRKTSGSDHARNWRPHVLVFTSDVEQNTRRLETAWALGGRRGVLTVATLIEGELDDVEDHAGQAERAQQHLLSRGIRAFCEVDVVPDLESGMVTVTQAHGMAGLASNTVMLGWPDDERFLLPVMRVLRRLERLGKSLLIVRQRNGDLVGGRRIVVWWSGREDNGDLMLLLAHVLKQSPNWRRADIHVRSVVSEEAAAPDKLDALRRMIDETRISATTEIVMSEPGADIAEVISAHSTDASLTLVGMPIPEPGREAEVAERLGRIVGGLGNVMLVRNSGPFRGALL